MLLFPCAGSGSESMLTLVFNFRNVASRELPDLFPLRNGSFLNSDIDDWMLFCSFAHYERFAIAVYCARWILFFRIRSQ